MSSLEAALGYLGGVVSGILLLAGGYRVLWSRWRGKQLEVLGACHFVYVNSRAFVELLVKNRNDRDDDITKIEMRIELGQQRLEGQLYAVYDLTETTYSLRGVTRNGFPPAVYASLHKAMPIPLKGRSSKRLLVTFTFSPRLREVKDEGPTKTIVDSWVPPETVDCVVHVEVLGSWLLEKDVWTRGKSHYLSTFPGSMDGL